MKQSKIEKNTLKVLLKEIPKDIKISQYELALACNKSFSPQSFPLNPQGIKK